VILESLSNIKIWIVSGVLLALIIGPMGDVPPTLITVVLMIQMIFSMEGLSFKINDLKEEKKMITTSVIACFGISTVVTLIIGSLFISSYPDVWMGWVILAAVPSAVSVVTMSLYLNGNVKMTVLSSAAIYLLALIITPLITIPLIGESVDSFKILQYVILFVAVPMIFTIPMKKLNIRKEAKYIVINLMMFLLIILSLGQNRDYVFGDPELVFLIILGCVFRTFGVGFIMMFFMKRSNVDRNNGMAYISMAVWKNSGLAITLCMVLFLDSSIAVIPCVISLLIELLWFTIMVGYTDRIWPAKKNNHING